ncbi:hypothetical protein [Leucobacter salsicius]|uniref:hypothetical protein n=1 Tax=Leucobacter salsicius TaxID=664638 RepID=UPI0003470A4F|nr:hypothetical protein [Leucobacter salsicius]
MTHIVASELLAQTGGGPQWGLIALGIGIIVLGAGVIVFGIVRKRRAAAAEAGQADSPATDA